MQRFFFVLSLALTLACGGDDTSSDAAADTATDVVADTTTDAPVSDSMTMSDAPDPAACDTAVADGPCSFDGQNCGSCTDLCAACSLLRCNAGRWRAIERPARCFSCGSLQCLRLEQYCSEVVGGPAPGTSSFSCEAKPESCPGELSCDCLDAMGGECDDSGDGIVLRQFAP